MSSVPTQKDANLVQLYARRGALATVVVILIALFGGNYLRREHPYLIGLIIPAAVAAGLGLAYLLFKQASGLPKASRKKHFLRLILVLLLAAVVCEYSIVAAIERIHFVKYSALGFFLFHSLFAPGASVGSALIRSLPASMVVGVLEECTQFFLPGRVFDTRDILLNLSGCIIGSLLAVVTARAEGENTELERSFG